MISMQLLLDSQVTVSNAIGVVSSKSKKVVFMTSKLVQMMDQDSGLIIFRLLITGVSMEPSLEKVKPDFQRDIMTLEFKCSKMEVVHQHMLTIKDQTPKTNGNLSKFTIDICLSKNNSIFKNKITIT